MSEIEAVVKELETLLTKRRWLLERIERREQKFGISTEKFLKMWRSGELPEPDDSDLLEDFLSWEADAEELESLERRLKNIVQGSR